MKRSLLFVLCLLVLFTSCVIQPPKYDNTHTIITSLKKQDGELFIRKKNIEREKMTTVKLSEDPDLKDFPILNINGEIGEASKENKVTVQLDYYSPTKTFEGQYATLKVQGNSSVGYPKKNYNIQFYKDESLEDKDKIKIVDEWGKQSKYTLKANYIDYSQARNIVSCRIYSKIAKSRGLNDELDNAPNMGVIDGFPVLVFLNGSFYGLFTLNIPKDNWLFGMTGKSTPNGAIVEASKVTDYSKLNTPITTLEKDNEDGVEAEFIGDNLTDQDVIDSFNAFTEKVRAIDSKDSLLQAFSADSATLQRTVDCYIFSLVACASDNVAKNILYANYDITKEDWFPSIYDFDATFGLGWTGLTFFDADEAMLPSEELGNLMWQKLYKYYFDEVSARYKELRSDILSINSIKQEFEDFLDTIPKIVKETDTLRWLGIPSRGSNNLDQITGFLTERFAVLDETFGL